ncbi:hypothetical protein GIB67_021987 [Kingdonia uniflora]|uniref:Uncharacterized protein n=1 Tax=Kingdonia uniflora TaxID=39325 RepID=A0A7J7P7T2_9MAGN|nr:hypothetical protein GIB67_021987 [Kingdonia uniflora]
MDNNEDQTGLLKILPKRTSYKVRNHSTKDPVTIEIGNKGPSTIDMSSTLPVNSTLSESCVSRKRPHKGQLPKPLQTLDPNPNFDEASSAMNGSSPRNINDDSVDLGSKPMPNVPPKSTEVMHSSVIDAEVLVQSHMITEPAELNSSSNLAFLTISANLHGTYLIKSVISLTGEPIDDNTILESSQYASIAHPPVSTVTINPAGMSTTCIPNISNDTSSNSGTFSGMHADDCSAQTVKTNHISQNNVQVNIDTTKGPMDVTTLPPLKN